MPSALNKWQLYLDANPDLVKAGVTTKTGRKDLKAYAQLHWQRHGQSEGRKSPDQLLAEAEAADQASAALLTQAPPAPQAPDVTAIPTATADGVDDPAIAAQITSATAAQVGMTDPTKSVFERGVGDGKTVRAKRKKSATLLTGMYGESRAAAAPTVQRRTLLGSYNPNA